MPGHVEESSGEGGMIECQDMWRKAVGEGGMVECQDMWRKAVGRGV